MARLHQPPQTREEDVAHIHENALVLRGEAQVFSQLRAHLDWVIDIDVANLHQQM
jgi:hypothetical protein